MPTSRVDIVLECWGTRKYLHGSTRWSS